jgi:hypothetical protein
MTEFEHSTVELITAGGLRHAGEIVHPDTRRRVFAERLTRRHISRSRYKESLMAHILRHQGNYDERTEALSGTS